MVLIMTVQVAVASLMNTGFDDDEDERIRFNIKYNDFFQVFRFRASLDKPCATNAWTGDCDFRYLEEDIHKWMIENNIIYNIKFVISKQDNLEHISWVLEFDNNENAVLFKLTWC
jgi:hypothetical protein